MTTTDTSVSAEYDPFEEFNAAMGAGRVENPYPEFIPLREESPVSAIDIREQFGLEMEDDDVIVYTVNTFDAVQQVLRDNQTFSSAGYEEIMGKVFGHSILEMDEPEHHTYRSLIQQAFSRKAMLEWERDLIGPVVADLISEFEGDGEADLVRQLTFPFPFNVIAEMLALPQDDHPRFHRLATELISVSIDMERALGASAALYEYFCGIISQRREDPARDLVSVLTQAEMDGVTLTDDEICAFLRLLLSAGAETTYRSSSNLLFGLLTHPEQLDALRDDRSLMPQAIEEGLRWEPPLLTIVRSPVRDIELHGVEIPAGASVVVNIGSANHDHERWEDAEAFDIFREQKPHVAFASGVHMCLGMHLARMETTVVLNAVLDGLPNLRLDPTADAYITGMTFRAPPALPVLFG